MIFYFTGTGNSRWVAEALGTAFDEPLVSIADALNEGKDEERLSKVETYIKRLCLAKQKESLYPWAPDEAELTCKIAESEVDFNNGDYCTQTALKKKLQKKLASW